MNAIADVFVQLSGELSDETSQRTATEENRMTSGTIKRVVRDKGFGFIADDDQQQEYFFHSSACRGTRFEELREGQRVTFEVGQSAKGPRAENVTPQ